jgi:hypothetical protein
VWQLERQQIIIAATSSSAASRRRPARPSPRGEVMPWRPGALSGDPDYEIHDELYMPDGRCVAVFESFTPAC